jgi:hypothetical protein
MKDSLARALVAFYPLEDLGIDWVAIFYVYATILGLFIEI